MELFNIIVVVIAVVLLIGILTAVGLLITKTNKEGTIYPPTINQCPDGWIADSSYCIIPTTGNLGSYKSQSDFSDVSGYNLTSSGIYEINFNDPGWTSSTMTTQCNKRLWANSNGIVWDTITNYNQC